MIRLGLGEGLDEIQDSIKKIKSEISKIEDGHDDTSIPELIESTNLLRINEYLRKSNEKRTELLGYYELYSDNLEKTVKTLLEIQNDLKDLLREQVSLKSKKRR
jgi:hypothetical protein